MKYDIGFVGAGIFSPELMVVAFFVAGFMDESISLANGLAKPREAKLNGLISFASLV